MAKKEEDTILKGPTSLHKAKVVPLKVKTKKDIEKEKTTKKAGK